MGSFIAEVATAVRRTFDEIDQAAQARSDISVAHVDARRSFALARETFVLSVSQTTQDWFDAGGFNPDPDPNGGGGTNSVIFSNLFPAIYDAENTAFRGARFDRAGDVGAAWLSFATAAGQSGVTHATSYNTAEQQLVSDLQGIAPMPDSYEQSHVTSTGNARLQQATDRATAYRDFTADQNGAWSTYSGGLRDATADRRLNQVEAFANYQMARRGSRGPGGTGPVAEHQ